MDTFIILLIYLTDVINYSLGLKVVFKLQIERWWTFPACFFVYAYFVTHVELNEDTMYFALYGMLLITMLVMVKCNSFRKLSRILLLFLILSSFEEGLEVLYSRIFLIDTIYADVPKVWIAYIISSISCIFLFLIIIVVKNNFVNLKENIEKIIRDKMYYILFVSTFLLLFSAATLCVVSETITNQGFLRFISIMSILSFLCTGALVLITVYIKKMNERLNEVYETERLLNKMKVRYYESLLNREEETKKYRHDLNNHLLCLTDMVANMKMDEIDNYLQQMRNQLAKVQDLSCDVGHIVFNALLNEYLSLLDKEVEISVEGKCIKPVAIEDIDLCIIFSNLLQNAVEELQKNSNRHKFISISFKQGDQFMRVLIVNSLVSKRSKAEFDLLTTKKDKHNHGYGLINVRNTLEKNNGILKIESINNKFSASFIINNNP